MRARAWLWLGVATVPLGCMGRGNPAGFPSASEVSDVQNVAAAYVDGQLLARLHHANEMEIRCGTMAKQRGADAAVKRYGDLLARDHQFAERLLARYAKNRGISIPAVEPVDDTEKAAMAAQMKTMAGLQELGGAAFDRAFTDAMIGDHGQALHLIDEAMAVVKDPDLRSVMAKLRPILDQHGHIAADLYAKQPVLYATPST
jgi:putative membrane protein